MALPSYTFYGLKKIAKSFIDRLPGSTADSIEQGWKMFALAYLNTEFSDQQRNSDGPALYQVIYREYVKAQGAT